MRILVIGASSDRDTLPPPPPDPGDVDGELRSFIQGRQNARVLIVDDDAAIAEVLGEILEDAGYEVDRAEDGVEAIRKIIDGELYDLMLVDLMMPRAPGQSVLGFIGPSQWGDPHDPHYIPQLVITAHAFRETADMSDERFIHLYGSPMSARRGKTNPPPLAKPFDLPLLLQTVRRAIDRKRGHDAE